MSELPVSSFLALSLADLQRTLAEMGVAAFRARQIHDWIYRKMVLDFERMTNLPAPLRAALAAAFPQIVPQPASILKDPDGTRKLVLPLADGHGIEAVSIPGEDSLTFCVSSQVGCPVRCTFCHTGTQPFVRNLTREEILMQFFSLVRFGGDRPTNVVFMGMGEPFLNLKAVFEAIDILTDDKGINLGSRRITVSTAGVIDGIDALAERPGEVNLAISLHTVDEAARQQIVPISRQFPLDDLRAAVVRYLERTGRRVSFEVVLLRGLNDQLSDALNLASFCEGLLCHVNLVRFNPYPGCPWQPALPESEKEFRKILKKASVPVTVRRSRGSSILAACGQLVGKETHGQA